ncbi:MAG TPA: DedA family protein [Candidatus Binataceae bacterium]|nr:DedA family protein [Candidatus Binataceae bacterium]
MGDPASISEWLAGWGYGGIFVLVFVGNLGIPVPEETVMVIAGFLAGRNLLDLRAVYAVVVLSAVTGDCCGYLIGRTGGQRLVLRLADTFAFVRTRYDGLQAFFQSHGNKAVFMARFVAGARFLAGPMAGACGMPFFRFLGWNVLGAITWCTVIVTIGYLVGDELYHYLAMVHFASRGVAAVVLVTVAFAALYFWRRERNNAVTRSQS